jgi:hypothetical protein
MCASNTLIIGFKSSLAGVDDWTGCRWRLLAKDLADNHRVVVQPIDDAPSPGGVVVSDFGQNAQRATAWQAIDLEIAPIESRSAHAL